MLTLYKDKSVIRKNDFDVPKGQSNNEVKSHHE